MASDATSAAESFGVDTLVVDNYDSFTYNLVQYLEELGAAVTVVRNDALSAAALAALRPRRVVISPGPGAPRDAGASLELVRLLAGKVPLLGVCLGMQAMFEAFGGTVTHAGEVVHGKACAVRHDARGLFAGLPSPLRAVRYHSLAGTWESLPDCLEVTCTSGGGGGGGGGSGGGGGGGSESGGSGSGSGSASASGSGSGAPGADGAGPLPAPPPRAAPPPPPGTPAAPGATPPVIIQGVRHRRFTVEGVQFHPESCLSEHGHAMLRNFLALEGGEWGPAAQR